MVHRQVLRHMSASSYFRPCIERMAGYVPGAQPSGAIYAKLNANENPYPPSPRVVSALREAAGDSLRLYPDAMATVLRERIADYHGLSPERVLVGNGSDDLLTMILRSFVGEGQTVVAPRPTYWEQMTRGVIWEPASSTERGFHYRWAFWPWVSQ